MTPSQILEARNWLADCSWEDMEPEDFAELSADVITRGIARYYGGGVTQFLEDVE